MYLGVNERRFVVLGFGGVVINNFIDGILDEKKFYVEICLIFSEVLVVIDSICLLIFWIG